MVVGHSKGFDSDSDLKTRRSGPTLLVIDDESDARDRLEFLISGAEELRNLNLLYASTLPEALDTLAVHQVHAILLDKNLSSSESSSVENGIEGIPDILRLQPHIQILVLTGSHDIPDVVRAMNLGAFNYITKETHDELLISHIERAIQVSRLKLDKERSGRSERSETVTLGGNSKVFRNLLKQAETFSKGQRPILLLGETGSGKTMLAQWIHDQRCNRLGQKDLPFFPVNVATLSKNLIESELFGHERSAFTDAKQMKRGLFEIARNGTLFLDEIGELPLELQSKLLLVIDQGIFQRVAGTETLTSHARIILATHRNLEQMVQEGTFREDLYDRISPLTLRMPTLDERREDIPEIIKAMLPKACEVTGVQIQYEEIPEDFIRYITDSASHGNIRRIRNQLELLLILAPSDKAGRPVFTRWRSFPGLFLEKNNIVRKQLNESQQPLTYSEFNSRPKNLIEGKFPGMNDFLEKVKVDLLEEVSSKFTTRREMATALGVLETTFSMLVKRHPELEKKLKKKGKKQGEKLSYRLDSRAEVKERYELSSD